MATTGRSEPQDATHRSLCPVKAEDILQNWERTADIFRRPTAWLKLLRICAAGPAGVSYRDLRGLVRGCTGKHVDQDQPNAELLSKWEAAGLVTLRIGPGNPRGGRKPYIATATDKAYKLLRIDP